MVSRICSARATYYIELQDHGLEEDNIVLPQLIKLARETGIPMAATNDSHYLRKEDAKMQSILLCIQTGKTVDDEDRMEFQTENSMSKAPMRCTSCSPWCRKPARTRKIAERCNFDFEFGKYQAAVFQSPGRHG